MLAEVALPTTMADPSFAWPTLLLQGGAFALLAYVVVRIAPAMMKDMREERESRDIRFEKIVSVLQLGFLERNAMVLEAIKKQTDSWVEEIRRNTDAITKATQNVCRYPYNSGERPGP